MLLGTFFFGYDKKHKFHIHANQNFNDYVHKPLFVDINDPARFSHLALT